MGRKNRRDPASRPLAESASFGVHRVQEFSDGSWNVRSISAAAASKPYRCPGCNQEIRPGVAHVVAWRAQSGGEDDRRHWHTPCWRNRTTRR